MISPEEQLIERDNFNRLVGDIAWFGLALAATSRFLSIYAIRLGASSEQLAWLASLPGIALLISTALSPWWRNKFSNSVKALILPGLGFRMIFLLPVFAPFFPLEWQPVWLIASALIPAIPQGIAGAIFIMMMREAISDGRMNTLLSRRSTALNVAVALGALSFGLMLEVLPFPINYQAMFLLAFGFALLSQWQILNIRVLFPSPLPESKQSVWTVIVSPAFMPLAFITFMTHVAFFSIITITPMHLVDGLGASEGFMGLFGLSELVAGATIAMFTDTMIRRIGTQAMIALSMTGTALAALIFATAGSLEVTLLGAAISGASWTAAGIGLLSFMFQRMPADSSAQVSMAFQQTLALGIFIGPLLGGMIENTAVGLPVVILAGASLRLLAAFVTYYNPVDLFMRQLSYFEWPGWSRALHWKSRRGS